MICVWEWSEVQEWDLDQVWDWDQGLRLESEIWWRGKLREGWAAWAKVEGQRRSTVRKRQSLRNKEKAGNGVSEIQEVQGEIWTR